MTAAEVVLPATNRQISVSATHGGAAACGNARANPVASQTDCRLNVVAESDGDNGDAGADDGQDEGVLGRGRAALVLPKPLTEIQHRFSSDERRDGIEGVGACRSQWSQPNK